MDWPALASDYDRIRERIARVVPGFDDFNRRVREPGGFLLPNLARDRREFTTTTGKANFTYHPIHRVPLPPREQIIMTVRSHDQYNTTDYTSRGHAASRATSWWWSTRSPAAARPPTTPRRTSSSPSGAWRSAATRPPPSSSSSRSPRRGAPGASTTTASKREHSA